MSETKQRQQEQNRGRGQGDGVLLCYNYTVLFFILYCTLFLIFCQVGDLLIGWLLYKLACLHSQMLVHVIYLTHNQGKLVQLSLKVSMSPLIHLVLFPVFS